MHFDPVHIHQDKGSKNSSFLMLLLPIIVFALILAVLFSYSSNNEVARTNGQNVLGTQND